MVLRVVIGELYGGKGIRVGYKVLNVGTGRVDDLLFGVSDPWKNRGYEYACGKSEYTPKKAMTAWYGEEAINIGANIIYGVCEGTAYVTDYKGQMSSVPLHLADSLVEAGKAIVAEHGNGVISLSYDRDSKELKRSYLQPNSSWSRYPYVRFIPDMDIDQLIEECERVILRSRVMYSRIRAEAINAIVYPFTKKYDFTIYEYLGVYTRLFELFSKYTYDFSFEQDDLWACFSKEDLEVRKYTGATRSRYIITSSEQQGDGFAVPAAPFEVQYNYNDRVVQYDFLIRDKVLYVHSSTSTSASFISWSRVVEIKVINKTPCETFFVINNMLQTLDLSEVKANSLRIVIEDHSVEICRAYMSLKQIIVPADVAVKVQYRLAHYKAPVSVAEWVNCHSGDVKQVTIRKGVYIAVKAV